MRSLLVVAPSVAMLLAGCPALSPSDDTPDPDALLVFHNHSGPMCLAALEWLADMRAAHPGATIVEHLTYEPGETARLLRYAALHAASQGVSDRFQYLPIIFYQGRAFSGFNDEIAQTLEALLVAAEAAS